MSAPASLFRPAQSSWRADPAAVISRPDAAEVQIAQWNGLAIGLARSAAEVALATWDGAMWPKNLLGHACLLSEDGLSVVHYLQWAGAAPAKAAGLDILLPGVERETPSAYRRYRSRIATIGETPGVVALVTYETQGEQAAERFIESMTDPSLPTPAGLIAGHYHVSRQGDRVLNYAEWADVAANQAFRNSREAAVFGRVVEASPGVRPLGGALYRPFAQRRAPI